MRLLLFSVDSIRGAVRVADVVEVVRAVAVMPLPGSPAVVEGVIDLRGSVVPVFDLRRRFGRAPRDVDPADVFVIVRASDRVAALHADAVSDLADVDDRAVADPRAQTAAGDFISGVAMLPDGLALISDIERFLSHSEAVALDDALSDREHDLRPIR
jgi:purine-binding chemotaxis protein CheW